MALVRGPTARSTRSGRRAKVSGSMSTKTVVAPTASIDSEVAKKVNGEVTTSSPGPTPRARRRDHQRVGPGVDPHRVLHPEVRGHLALQGLHLRTQDEVARRHHPAPGGVELGRHLGQLGCEVEDRDGGRRRHAHPHFLNES